MGLTRRGLQFANILIRFRSPITLGWADTTPKPDPELVLGEVMGLYANWRYITSQLTSREKEVAARAVERWSRELNGDDPDVEPMQADRWWLCPTCGIESRLAYLPGQVHRHCQWEAEHREAVR